MEHAPQAAQAATTVPMLAIAAFVFLAGAIFMIGLMPGSSQAIQPNAQHVPYYAPRTQETQPTQQLQQQLTQRQPEVRNYYQYNENNYYLQQPQQRQQQVRVQRGQWYEVNPQELNDLPVPAARANTWFAFDGMRCWQDDYKRDQYGRPYIPKARCFAQT